MATICLAGMCLVDTRALAHGTNAGRLSFPTSLVNVAYDSPSWLRLANSPYGSKSYSIYDMRYAVRRRRVGLVGCSQRGSGFGFFTWDYSVCRPGTVSECWSVCKKEITVGLATGIFWASGPGCDLVWKAYRGKGTGSYGY